MFGKNGSQCILRILDYFEHNENYIHYRGSLQVACSNYVHNFYCSFIGSTQKSSVIRLSVSDCDNY